MQIDFKNRKDLCQPRTTSSIKWSGWMSILMSGQVRCFSKFLRLCGQIGCFEFLYQYFETEFSYGKTHRIIKSNVKSSMIQFVIAVCGVLLPCLVCRCLINIY